MSDQMDTQWVVYSNEATILMVTAAVFISQAPLLKHKYLCIYITTHWIHSSPILLQNVSLFPITVQCVCKDSTGNVCINGSD